MAARFGCALRMRASVGGIAWESPRVTIRLFRDPISKTKWLVVTKK
jgi:hypothetical protein